MNALTPLAAATEDASLLSSESADREMAMARDLVQRLGAANRRSTAEMLHELRRAFPDSPLAVRVRALEALRRS